MAARNNKKEMIVARVTVQLTGTAKKSFFEEVERTGIAEAKLARQIISDYYKNGANDNSNAPKSGKNRF